MTPKEKVTLFLRLFRGRDDVYPKLWENQKVGKKGYSPACANEWVRKVCDKRRVKCGEYPNRAFLAVTADTVLMLARMFEKRRIGYRAMGYREGDDEAFLK